MFQRKVIPLTGRDRTDGEDIGLAASGGIFFDSVDGVGLLVRFDEDQTVIPIRPGRSIDRKFERFYLVHGPGYTGTVVAYTYEKGEGIFDAPSNAELAAVEGAVLGVFNMNSVTGGRFAFFELANPAASGVLLKVTRILTGGTTEYELRRFATTLPSELVGTVTASRKFEDLREWAATPTGVLTGGQNPSGGSTPPTHEGGVTPLVKVTPATAVRTIYEAMDGGGIIVPPGEFLVCGPTAAGTIPVGVAIYWREFAQG